MAAAATEIGDLPGTMSSSTAFLAMYVAAFWTEFGNWRFAQNRDMKSPVVMRSTLVSSALRMSLKHLPISFLLILLTAQISLKVLGTPACRHAMYKQAEAIASFERPFRFFPSWTCLKRVSARSTITFCRFIRSAMPFISRKAFISARSELLICKIFLLIDETFFIAY